MQFTRPLSAAACAWALNLTFTQTYISALFHRATGSQKIAKGLWADCGATRAKLDLYTFRLQWRPVLQTVIRYWFPFFVSFAHKWFKSDKEWQLWIFPTYTEKKNRRQIQQCPRLESPSRLNKQTHLLRYNRVAISPPVLTALVTATERDVRSTAPE